MPSVLISHEATPQPHVDAPQAPSGESASALEILLDGVEARARRGQDK